MKSLVWLTESVLRESGTRCGADPSRDILTVTRRVEAEGESFLTITLPAFCAAFDRAIADGCLRAKEVPMFHWHRRGLPEFLRGFLSQIFDTNGCLLQKPSVEAISCVRQICLLQKKILRPCTDARLKKAIKGFKECEHEVAQLSIDLSTRVAFAKVSSIVWADILSSAPFGDIRLDPAFRPIHGPGSTEERILGNQKYVFRRWHERLEKQFPFTEYGIGSLRNLYEDDCPLNVVDFIEPENEEPVRVVFVPKTQKTPRVIAIEPVCMQYMQQGILRWLTPRIERGKFTGGRVNFTDQSINARLALTSSKDQSYATIDLSEASDRVASVLVEDMLANAPVFRDLVYACRSTRAKLPDGEILTLKKFASMGSALCFPIEAMVFFCIIVTDRLLRAKTPITVANTLRACEQLYVYGDDIIVPTDEAPAVCRSLELFGLKVNQRKSFWTGKFRESCGMDAYDGEDVKPVYVHDEQPAHRQDAESLSSWTAMANLLYKKGYWQTTRKIRFLVEKILGKLPFAGEQGQGLHWSSFSNAATWRKWNPTLHRLEDYGWVARPLRRPDLINGDQALLKCFSTINLKKVKEWIARLFPSEKDSEHLSRTVVRGRLALARRWVPAI